MSENMSPRGRPSGLSPLASVAILLVGSGGAGAAISLIGQEDTRVAGFATLAVCLVVAVFLLIFAEFAESKRRQKSREAAVDTLNDLHADAFKTIGEFFVRDSRRDSGLLRTLAKDLRRRAADQKRADEDILNSFRKAAREVALRWEEVARQAEAEAEGKTEEQPLPKEEPTNNAAPGPGG